MVGLYACRNPPPQFSSLFVVGQHNMKVLDFFLSLEMYKSAAYVHVGGGWVLPGVGWVWKHTLRSVLLLYSRVKSSCEISMRYVRARVLSFCVSLCVRVR